MAGFGSVDVTNIQRITTLTGAGNMEFGDFCGTSATTHAIPTTFTTLISGMAMGDGPAYGMAISICEGPTIDFTFSAASEKVQYQAFGW